MSLGVTLLIVDDDKLLVKKLEETVTWEQLGITAVLTAFNIRQAKKLLEEYPIQILLCDIDMPQGNGLELLEWIRERNMDIECAFLSSYANFAYAQKAMKLSTREYLLKPISNSDLEQALKKIVWQVQIKGEKNRNLSDLKKDDFWRKVIIHKEENKRKGGRLFPGDFYLSQDRFTFVAVKVSDTVLRDIGRKDIPLYNFVLHNIATEFYEKSELNLESIIEIRDLEWILVFAATGEFSDLVKSTQEMKVYLSKGLSQRIILYFSNTVNLSESVQELDKLEYLVQYGVPDEKDILLAGDSMPEKVEYFPPSWNIWEVEMLYAESLKKTEESITAFIQEQKAASRWTRETLGNFVRELVQMMYKYLNDQGVTFSQLFDPEEFERMEGEACSTISGVNNFVSYLFHKLEGNKQADTRKETIVGKLREYIEAHLKEDLSRKDLAQAVYLSEDYVSKLFISVTGMSIPGYIASRRVEEAKEYLRSSSLPVSRIAMEVGFNNFSYFSKTFRDLVGCTPNEYRSKGVKQNY